MAIIDSGPIGLHGESSTEPPRPSTPGAGAESQEDRLNGLFQPAEMTDREIQEWARNRKTAMGKLSAKLNEISTKKKKPIAKFTPGTGQHRTKKK